MAYLLSLLPAVACPLGMGLMMWLMMGGTKGQPTDAMQMPAQDGPTDARLVGGVPRKQDAVVAEDAVGQARAVQTGAGQARPQIRNTEVGPAGLQDRRGFCAPPEFSANPLPSPLSDRGHRLVRRLSR